MDTALLCSFCHKSQDSVGKLISTPPSDYPRVYICDECVLVCNSILEDDVPDAPRPGVGYPTVRHPVASTPFSHALAPQFFELVEEWMSLETDGRDASHVLSEMRRVAAIMIAGDATPT